MTPPRFLLQADIVDSVQLATVLGDAGMTDLSVDHDRLARDLMVVWHGREIDKSDGFLLIFASADEALSFASAYHLGLGTLRVQMRARIGIHQGNISLRENTRDDISRGAKPVEVDGLAKPTTARIMGLAAAGQTLISRAAWSSLPDPLKARIHALGHWRIKGLEEPLELFEASDDAVVSSIPDSKNAYRVIRRNDMWLPVNDIAHSLPAERDSFVGRDVELRALARRFESGARLVSVLGVGGTGKTRLARRFGWTWLGDYVGGVWFCDLTHAVGLDGILHAVAEGLDIPLAEKNPVAQLGSALAARGSCLVILDNFEQVTRFAEQTVGQWLSRAALASFVVTSREVLGIAGEETLALAPLATSEAADLFLRRAGAIGWFPEPGGADHAFVERLVRLLDGLPLAIELAAARVRVMSPKELFERMGERFRILASSGGRVDRHATLRATFDWSWDLLSVAERATLAQLSVFDGGISLAAAEAVVDLTPYPQAPWIVDVLQSLVEKSLLSRSGERRFTLLQSLQEYAAHRLVRDDGYPGSGAGALAGAQARHMAFFARVGAVAADAELVTEMDNVVAACRRSTILGDRDCAVACLEGAWVALEQRGPFRVALELAEGIGATTDLGMSNTSRLHRVMGKALRKVGQRSESRRCIDVALTAARASGNPTDIASALSLLADLDVADGRMDAGEASLAEAIAIAQATTNRRLECECLNILALKYEHQGDMAEARRQRDLALAAARKLQARRWEGICLSNLANLLGKQGRLVEARTHYDSALAIAISLGDRQLEANNRTNLGFLLQGQGRLLEAVSELNLALDIYRTLGHSANESITLCNLGIAHESLNQPELAQEDYAEAINLARKLGDRRSEGQFLSYLGLLHARHGRYVDADDLLQTSQQLLTEVSDQMNLALLHCNKAEMETLRGNAVAAARSLAAAKRLALSIGVGSESELGSALTRAEELASQQRVNPN